MNGKSTLGILLGDVAGAEPEVIIELTASGFYDGYCRLAVIGDVRVFERGAGIYGLKTPVQVIDRMGEVNWTKGIPVLDQRGVGPEQVLFVNISIESGCTCLNMLKTAIELCQAGRTDGFCFAPLDKRAMIQVGCPSESEHHYMAHLFRHTEPFEGINVLRSPWTARATSYIPISKTNDSLTVDTIMRAIRLANVSPRNPGIEKPRLILAALNPHCGEGGKCGREEADIVAPVIEKAREMGTDTSGPFLSNILFIKASNGDFDGVVTMYHDQGQIAPKLKGLDQGITIAGGLPAPTVTCAHGTTYDIAGKGVVKTPALEGAIKVAAEMAAHLKGH